ncbi:MAG: L,D-transpeptidase [Rhodothermaceae bacterium]|nr:L,D-transpeptidase [Rhodothermaceae bacterium]
MRAFCLLFALSLTLPLFIDPAAAQSRRLYNQAELEELLYARRDSLELLPEVTYQHYVLQHPTNNSIWARHDLYELVGDGDAEAGKARLGMVEFFNRTKVHDLGIGDTLILPSHYDLDPRAYSPFPRYYAGAADFDKLFIIHKGVQAWAGYEQGRLARWGLVNTGAEESRTPAGRFNFNWKEQRRVSTLSPPGETWLMRYVFNFHHERGIHIHQYQMPTGEPASHGCVRLILADARWIYDWADSWRTTAGTGNRGLPSANGRIVEQGTTVLVLGDGEEPDGPPQRFVDTVNGPTLRVVELPNHPYDVPPGSPQQQMFDRQRTQSNS